ncbi:MAG: sensor histidine kinase [Anaerolineae bacterium]
MRSQLSFRGLIILLYIGTVIPLLAIVGTVVYGLQRYTAISETQSLLIDLVTADASQVTGDSDLTSLAENLGAHLKALNADLFIRNTDGNLVKPALGANPWLDAAAHQAVLASKTSGLQRIGSGASTRIVYLAPLVDLSGNALGTVEASVSLNDATRQLVPLRQWMLIGIAIAGWLVVALSISISGIITRPMINLVKSVEGVRKGNLESRAKVPQVYELGQLALTYNQMLDRISEELNNQAQLAENMRRFAADASHELRSPLAVFRNSVELLKKAAEQNDYKSFAEILAILPKETDVMTGLVENLLLLARLDQADEAALALLHFEVVHPFPLLEEVYERSQLLAQGQKLELLWPTGDGAPIWADCEMLRRALNNIVENAIAHTPPGKKITLSLENQESGVCFIIADQGCGIAPDKLSRIYERFYRGDEARNRQTAGTGLGLAIVAAIVRIHGGEIQVESIIDQGTRFRLTFKQMDPNSPES